MTGGNKWLTKTQQQKIVFSAFFEVMKTSFTFDVQGKIGKRVRNKRRLGRQL